MIKRPVFWVAAILAVTAVLAGLAMAAGVRFYTVMTPSMGTAAPVGTLVLTRPAPSYQVGDIVTYERDDRNYTHRIITANPDGSFITKGDLNSAADPLPVAKSQVVGRAIWLGAGLGWLWQGLPWLVLGFLTVYAASFLRRLDHTWQWIVRISGWTLVFCLVAVWLHPWVSLTQLAWEPSDLGGVTMRVVNTGLFPLDVLGTRLVSGQDAMVHVTEQNAHGYYTLTPTLGFYWWEQVGLFLLCLIPFGLSFLIRQEEATPARAIAEPQPLDEDGDAETAPIDDQPGDTETTPIDDMLTDADSAQSEEAAVEGARSAKDRRHLILTSAVLLAIIVSVSVVGLSTTSAALTAKVTNSTNTAGTRLTCRGALVSVGKSNSIFAFALEPTGASAKTETDLSGNTTGNYKVTPASFSTNVGCTQDKPLTAVTFSNSTSQCLSTTANSSDALTAFTLEAWFRTTATTAPATGFGKIIGFGASANSPIESTYDRHIYLNSSGQVVFGTYNGGYQTVTSSASKADQKWHHVMATFSSTTGMILYVDGVATSNTNYKTAEATTGFWKVGCGNLNGWPSPGGTTSTSGGTTYQAGYFNGVIQYAAVYTSVLSAADVTAHYQAGLS